MKALPHHDDRNHLRRSLVEASLTLFTPPGQPLSPQHADRNGSVFGSACAYNLAAAIEWVARNFDEDQADGLAAWLSESLANGDYDGLNEDIVPAEEAAR